MAEVERAKKEKIYPKGCTLIALSATKGQVEYLKNAQTVDTRWAVVIPKKEWIPRYVNYAIEQAFPEFYHKRKAGINFYLDTLLELEITRMPKNQQEKIVEMLEPVERKIKKEEDVIKLLERQKKVFLGKMFPESIDKPLS